MLCTRHNKNVYDLHTLLQQLYLMINFENKSAANHVTMKQQQTLAYSSPDNSALYAQRRRSF